MKKGANNSDTSAQGRPAQLYNHLAIEKKWQENWAASKIYKSAEDAKKGKYYVLDMFPYPSGEGLHVGHPKGYIATDVVSRMKRMQGRSVLHPMGFDAFGLPAENYAIKMKTNPADQVAKNVMRFKKQLEIIGLDYDWSREINTTDPEYYRWTQWIFLQLLKKGLAHESYEPINWCPVDKTGLANEDIENGRCERCGTLVEKKLMKQWILKITDYADRLLSDLDAVNTVSSKPLLDWPESIKEAQRNWIGKSEGALIKFKLQQGGTSLNQNIEVFTTRPDTLFGVTYVVLAPEHPLVAQLLPQITNDKEVEAYISASKLETEIERTDAKKEKTGVELRGVTAVNPANNEEVPVWVSDYVLADYGTGAVMAVPAHDERDADFAKKFNLPVREIKLEDIDEMIRKFGNKVVKYKLRDWVFSRQRYWGEPIPVIRCDGCGVVPVPEKDLPVKLPKVESYEPTGTGESPLAAIDKWVRVKCPKCKGPAKRETNTMPQWAGSSWYHLRYMDPDNKKALVDQKMEKYWAPVDLYIGGAEHATRHLIYARFWHKFLYDIGVVSTVEPFIKLQSVGLIMGEDDRKMSKRFGNVVNPDDIVARFGADTLRVYEMFMGPFDQQIAWSTDSMVGSRRFIEKVWKLMEKVISDEVHPGTLSAPADAAARSPSPSFSPKVPPESSSDVTKILHRAVKKVTEDIEGLKFNTAISSLMITVNEMEKAESVSREQFELLLKILAPFAPHITDELWSQLGNEKSIHISEWPKYDPAMIVETEVRIIVQINGKVRGSFMATKDAEQKFIEETAKSLPEVKKWLDGKEIKKVVVVPNRLVSIVV